MVGAFFEILGQLINYYPRFAHIKPFPGVNLVLGKILVAAFLLTVLFTWPGIELLALIFPVSESLALLLIVAAWVLFILFFSATLFLLVLMELL